MGREGWGLLLNSIKFGDREWQVYKVNDKSIKRRCRGDFFQEARFRKSPENSGFILI